MNEELEQLLKDYVATANNSKYGGDWGVINSKFPELKDYDSELLKDYVATANNKEYKNDWGVINSKFTEFGVKKKDSTSEVSQEPVVLSGEELQKASQEPSSDPQSTLGTDEVDPTIAPSRADVPTPDFKGEVDSLGEYISSGKYREAEMKSSIANQEKDDILFEEERAYRTEKANTIEGRMFAFDWNKTSRDLTDEETKVADEILSLSNLKYRYLEEEGGLGKIGKGEDYVNDLMQRIPKEDRTSESFYAIYDKIDTELKKARTGESKEREFESLEKEFSDEVGSITYNAIKENITDQQFSMEIEGYKQAAGGGRSGFSHLFESAGSGAYLHHAPNEPLFFSENYVWDQFRNGNYESLESQWQRNNADKDSQSVYKAWKDGKIAVINPLYNEKYAPLVQQWLEEAEKKGGYELEMAAKEGIKGLEYDKQELASLYGKLKRGDTLKDEEFEYLENQGIDTKKPLPAMLADFKKRTATIGSEENILVQKNRDKVESEMGQFMSIKQRNIKKQYDILYALANTQTPQKEIDKLDAKSKDDKIKKNAQIQEKIDQIQNQINKTKGESEGDLFDPSGELINKEDADQKTLSWNREADKYKVKYTNNDREFNLRARDKLYFQFKYLEGKIAKQIESGQIETPWSESWKRSWNFDVGGLYDEGTENMALWGGTALLDKYRDTFQELRGVNLAISQNEDPAKLERSWFKSFASGFQEAVGTSKSMDIPKGFVDAQREFGGYVSPEQEARLEKTYGEEFFEVAGGSIPAMAKIIAVTLATEGLGFTAAYGNAFNTARTFVTPVGRSLLTAIEPVLLSGIQYELADEGFATGAGEGAGAAAYDLSRIPELLAKTKIGGTLKVVLNTFFKQIAMGGSETVGEYIGELSQRLYDDEEIGEALRNTIGEDPLRKLIMTYELSFILGSTSTIKNFNQGVKLMEAEIMKADSSDPSVIALQERIREKEKKKAEKNKSPEEKTREKAVKDLREKAVDIEAKGDTPVMEAVAEGVKSGELELTESITKAGETLAMVGGELTQEERTQVTADIEGIVTTLEAKGDKKSLAQAKELKAFEEYVNKPGTPDEDIVTKVRTKAEEGEKVEKTIKTKTEDVIQEDKGKQPTIEEEQRIDEEVSTPEEQQTIGEQKVSEQEADVLEEIPRQEEVGDDIILKHGTPHDFEKFQLEKIGTGEGNQAFGWGLYFTESNKIAEDYAKKLSKDKEGQIYTVKIKDGREKNWMEWRDALEEEHEFELADKFRKEGIEGKYYDWLENVPKSKRYHGAIETLLANIDEDGMFISEDPIVSGYIYKEMADFMGESKATEFMQSIGIDGVKYKSKGGLGDAYNYVVFNPESIEITEKTKLKQDASKELITEEKTTAEYTPKDKRYKINEKGEVVFANDTKKKKAGDKVYPEIRRTVLKEKAAFESKKEPTIEPQEGMSEKDYIESIITDSTNPLQVAEHIKATPAEGVGAKEQVIIDKLPYKVSRGTYVNTSDKNNITASMAKAYGFTEKGAQELDTIAKEMSEDSGMDITAEDIVNFMAANPQGRDQKKARTNKESIRGRLEQRFTDITGGLDYTAAAHESIVNQVIEAELADQFTDYPPDVLKAIEEYQKTEPDAETRYEEYAADEQVAEEVEPTKDDKGSKKEQTTGEKLIDVADKLQAGKALTLKEVQFAKDQGVDIKKPLEQQIEETLKEHKKNMGGLGPTVMINFKAVKSATKLVKLYTLKGVKSFKEFIRLSKLKPTLWLRKIWDSRSWNPNMSFGYKNLRGRISLDNSYEALTMLNAESKKLKKVTTEAEAEIAKERILDRVHEIVKMIDVQLISTKSTATKLELQSSRDYILRFYSSIKKDNAVDMAKRIGAELKGIEKAKEYDLITKKIGVIRWAQQQIVDSKSPQVELEKRLVKEVGKNIKMSESAAVIADLGMGMAEDQNRKISEYIFGGRGQTKNSLLNRMKKEGITEDDLGLFMFARHAPKHNERKAALQKIANGEVVSEIEQSVKDELFSKEEGDKKIQEYLKENPIDEAGSGMTNEESAEFMADFEKAGKTKALVKYADEFKLKVTDKIAENLYKGGIVTKEQYENLIKGIDEKTGVQFEFYAPLKVDGGVYNELFAEDSRKKPGRFGATTTTGMNVGVAKVYQKLTLSKKAGRIKYHHRNSPFKQSIQDLYSSAALVYRNKSHQNLYNMALDPKAKNPDIWIANPTKETTDLEGNKVRVIDTEDTIQIFVDGKVKRLKLVDPYLKKAWEKRTVIPAWQVISKVLNTLNSYLRSIYTIYDPDFAIRNKVRDMQDALFNLSEEDSRRVIAKFGGYFRRSMGAVANYEVGRDTYGSRLMEEMMAHGGYVSWANYDNVSSVVKDINKASKDFHRRASKNPRLLPRKAIKLGVKGLDIFNAMMEQSTRVSIYRALRDTKIEALSEAKTGKRNAKRGGMTLEQLEKAYPEEVREIKLEAANGSKNITINFNKKGLQGTFLNTLYLFSNAGIQANVKPFKVVGKKGAKLPKIALTAAILGGVAHKMMINSMLDDDDNDEMKDLLNEHDYENNIIIPLGNIKDGLIFTLPKPYGGFKMAWNIGAAIADYQSTGDASHIVSTMAREMYQILNPVSGGYSGHELSAMMPTGFKPYSELATNMDYAGNPITRTNYGELKPDYKIDKERTPEAFKDFAGWMYNTFGIDAHPETFRHLLGSYTGGVWSTGQRIISNFEGATSSQEYFFGEKYQKEGMAAYPGIRNFIKNVKSEKWRIVNKMYESNDKVIYIEKLTDQDVKDFGRYVMMSYNQELIDGDKADRLINKYSIAIDNAQKDGRITFKKAQHINELLYTAIKVNRK